MFVWLDQEVVLAVHEMQLAEHGGPVGVRDEGLLLSALARPENLLAYADENSAPDVADCAAAYGFGIARNHPFIDGNKRTAYVAMELFLALNNHDLTASDSEAILAMLALAAGDTTEPDFAAWIRANSALL